MTRETRLGVVVAGTFLSVVGGVVALKLHTHSFDPEAGQLAADRIGDPVTMHSESTPVPIAQASHVVEPQPQPVAALGPQQSPFVAGNSEPAPQPPAPNPTPASASVAFNEAPHTPIVVPPPATDATIKPTQPPSPVIVADPDAVTMGSSANKSNSHTVHEPLTPPPGVITPPPPVEAPTPTPGNPPPAPAPAPMPNHVPMEPMSLPTPPAPIEPHVPPQPPAVPVMPTPSQVMPAPAPVVPAVPMNDPPAAPIMPPPAAMTLPSAPINEPPPAPIMPPPAPIAPPPASITEPPSKPDPAQVQTAMIVPITPPAPKRAPVETPPPVSPPFTATDVPLAPPPSKPIPPPPDPVKTPELAPAVHQSPIESAPPVALAPPVGASTPPTAQPDPFKPVKPARTLPPPPNTDSYLEDEYRAHSGDSYRTISERFYLSDKYAAALAQYNKEHPLARETTQEPTSGASVWVPPIRVLERRFGDKIDQPKLDGNGVPVDPNRPVAMPTARPAADARLQYLVRSPETVGEIARRTLGDSMQGMAIYKLNPSINATQPLPAGTRLFMPSNARIDPANKP